MQLLKLFLISGLFISTGYAADFYVASTGNDNNSGSANSPWRTIQYAVDNTQVGPGDRVIVKDGNYEPFHITRSGNNGSSIVVMAENYLGAVISGNQQYDGRYAGIHILGDYISIENFRVNCSGTPASSPGERGIRLSGFPDDFSEGVSIRNNKVTGAGWVGITTSYANNVLIEGNDVSESVVQHGIYVANSGDGPIIRGNRIYDNNQAGLHMNGDLPGQVDGEVDGVISNAIIENNLIFGNSGGAASSAINLDGVNQSIIRNNLLINNFSQGISNFREDGGQPSSNNKILNNTIVMASSAFHALKFRNGSNGGYVRNNIVLQQGSGVALAVCAECMNGLDSDYNILMHMTSSGSTVEDYGSLTSWKNATGQDEHSFTVAGSSVNTILATLFTNPTTSLATANYALVANSPAIDAGIAVADAATDINGYNRPMGAGYDIGAYEFGGVEVMPTPQNVSVEKN